jgi:outer membrane biosynthesis protein TonB
LFFMYFDLYDDRPDYLAHGRDLAQLEDKLHLIIALMAALFLDITAIITLIVLPSMMAGSAKTPAQAAMLRKAEPERFVFMAPRLETPTRTVRPNAEASDRNSLARAPEQAKNPTNPLPFSRGNTPERVDQPAVPAPPQQARAETPPQNAQPPGQSGQNGENGAAGTLPIDGRGTAAGRNAPAGAVGPPGSLSAAASNPWRYAHGDVFDNPEGQTGQFGPAIEFDSKGVEFGPWLRRFIAQVKRNWNIPYAAMSFRGHVVITFNVQKNGAITELGVAVPSNVDGFNAAAYGALVASNPTYPLPPEYPSNQCAFKVTFYYNETPPR